MTNKKIVQEGIVTPQIDLGDQSDFGVISYAAGTITITADLTVSGTTTTVDTVDLNVTDNVILLNNGEGGAGVDNGTGISGLEIDRGSLDNARIYFDENNNEWRFAQADATNTVVASSATPTNNDHLTNKSYVDTEIVAAIGTVDELADMNDVDIPAPTDGYSLVYNSGSTNWEAELIPPGIASLTITSIDLDVGNAPGDDSLNGVTQFAGTSYQMDLKDNGVGAGSYISPDITVDAQGRVTAIADGDIFQTITADSGGPYAASGTDFFKISGGVGLGSILAGNVATVNLDDTAVTPGLYTLATVQVDQQGRITLASSGTIDTFKFVSADLGNNPVADGPSDTLNIIGDTGIHTSGDLGTDTIAVHLSNTTVSAGSYTAADITVNAQGQITSASNGAISTGEIENLAVTTAKLADNAVTTAKIAGAGANLTLNTNGGGDPVWEAQPTPSGFSLVGSLFLASIPVSISPSFSRFYTGLNVGAGNVFYDNYLIRVVPSWYTYFVGFTPEGYEIQWDVQQKFRHTQDVITAPRSIQNELSWTWSVNNVSGAGFDVVTEINNVNIYIYQPII